MKQVSLIIPIYNRSAITKDGLNLLYKTLISYHADLLGVSYSVIVIDDGSTDGSAEMIKDSFPQVHLLQHDGNLWWSGAVNVGSKYAIETLKTDYILLWNDDIYMDENYFNNLAAILKNDVTNNIYGSVIYEYPNKEKVWATGGYFNKYLGIRKTHRTLNKKRENQWFTGMGTVIPATIVTELNYWDAVNFPQYFGDIDFTLKAYNTGIKLITKPELRLWNKVEFSSFIAKNSWKDYFKSLRMIQSRYNVSKEALFLKRFSASPFWRIYFSFRQVKYFLQFMNNKYIKSK